MPSPQSDTPVARPVEFPADDAVVPVAIPLEDEPAPRRQTFSDFKKLAHDTPRPILYAAAFIFLGALSIPGIMLNRRIGRLERAFLVVGAALQTIGAVALLIGFVYWVIVQVQTGMNDGPPAGSWMR